MNINGLADILKRRAVARVYYFHTDHFEPWSKGINRDAVAAVKNFARMARRSFFSKSVNLFYMPFVRFRLDPGRMADGGLSIDPVVFGGRSESEAAMAKSALAPLEQEDKHEFHIHLHHERWTRNDGNFPGEVPRWVNAHSTPVADEARLRNGLAATRRYAEEDIGRPFNRWAFVHGNWALNASDRSICRVEGEVKILMEFGCFGDFTFPAGRPHCDPTILEEPYTCLPAAGPKAYDTSEALPKSALAQPFEIAPGRFFVWNSRVKARFSSLDYFSEENRRLFRQPEVLVTEWLEKSVLLGNSLFIKTHAHSMDQKYLLGKDGACTPHLFPEVQGVFDLLSRTCELAETSIQSVTVSQLMALLGNGSVAEGPSQTIPTLNRAAEEIGASLKHWASGGPDREAAAGSYYMHRIQGAAGLAQYERDTLNYICANFPSHTTRVTEVGAGLGTLTAALALFGYEVCAFEGAKGRAEGACFIRNQLAQRYPRLIDTYAIVQGFFPDALEQVTSQTAKRTVFVSTNLVNSHGWIGGQLRSSKILSGT
jgi:hypothetical protein